MENISDLNYGNTPGENIGRTDFNREMNPDENIGFSSAVVKAITESKEKVFQPFKSLDFYEESELLVLPSNHHYFYAEEELKNVKTLINLKKLNHIKHPVTFLHTLFRALPTNASFIGCFSDDKPLKGNGATYYKPSRLFSRFINFIDSKTDHFMDSRKVSLLLNTHGFRIVEMKEIDGLAYFYSRNMRGLIESGE